jgi:peptidase E
MEPPGSPLDDFILSLTSRPNPRVVFLGTATGDSERYRVNFYDAYLTRKCRPIALPLFGRPERPPADVVDEADVIYVGGGNTANMLAIWRVHGVDRAVRDAWQRGAVLAGVSAGAICGSSSASPIRSVPSRHCRALASSAVRWRPTTTSKPIDGPRFSAWSPAENSPPGGAWTTAWRCTSPEPSS